MDSAHFAVVEADVISPAADVPTRPAKGVLGLADRALRRLNAVMAFASGCAIAAAALVLTWEVAGRYFGMTGDWQDEMATFLLIGATFLSAGWTQARRGHVGIDALSHILPPAAERVRRRLADAASLAFCGFFTWKCWALTMEAWAEDQTSSSSWAPPLAIPYGLMTAGMALLCCQIALQVVARREPRPAGSATV